MCEKHKNLRYKTMSEEKKLHNRFDEYEIASVFTEAAEDMLGKKWKINRSKFYLKCLLGVLLFINGYLSHWGPWPWPSNYYFLIFSVIFYHVASYIYGRQSPVKNAEGNTVGQYNLGDKIITAVIRIGKDKQNYTLETMHEKRVLGNKQLLYTDFFTVSGVFLSYKFKRELERVVEQTEKIKE